MSKWNFTCYSFKDVRRILHRNKDNDNISTEDCKAILEGIQDSIKEIAQFYIKDEEMSKDYIEQIQKDIENNPTIDTVNHRLEEMYSFCDVLGVWLPIK